jgi:two-component system cell cycle response regulator CpdR
MPRLFQFASLAEAPNGLCLRTEAIEPAFNTNLPCGVAANLGLKPLAKNTFPAGTLMTPREMSMPQAKRYALVVEDDEIQRGLITDILQDGGFEVLQSDTAEAAMIILEEVGHDLSLMVADVRLNGDMPGSQLARFARQLYPNIRLIVTSGKDWPVLPEGAVFLRKPWRPYELIREARLATL